MKNKLIVLYIFTVAIAATFSSCKKEDNNPTDVDLTSLGVFVVNEGAFGASDASISYLNISTNVMSNGIFENTNGFPLGDLAQSMTIHASHAYIIVTGSKKVEVVNATTFNSIATITGFEGPRYMVCKGLKGYVSDWFDNEIKVVDLITNTITNSIPTGEGPDQMLLVGNNLVVTNVGGWGIDSTLTIIDTGTETVLATLEVGVCPNSIKADSNGKLWILCTGSTGPDYTGGTADDIAGSLWKINPATLNAELQLIMNSADHPSKLQINTAGTELYYINGIDGYHGKIVKMLTSETSLPSVSMTTKLFYGLGIDPVTNIVYGAYSPGFSQSGYVFRFLPTFQLIDSMSVGIGPNQFVFQ